MYSLLHCDIGMIAGFVKLWGFKGWRAARLSSYAAVASAAASAYKALDQPN